MKQIPNLSARLTVANKAAELLIYDYIGPAAGEVSAKSVVEQLNKLRGVATIAVRINSGGGSVWEALAIYNALSQHPARVVVTIEALAASAASVVAMAGDTVRIAEDAWLMIHRAHAIAAGGADDLSKTADEMRRFDATIADIYARKTTKAKDEILELMDAETWLDARQARELGFADEIVPAMKIAASVDLSRFCHVPSAAAARLSTSNKGTTMNPSYQEIVAACKGIDEHEDAYFIGQQIKAGANLDTIKANWMEAQRAKIESRDQQMQNARGRRSGVEPLRDSAAPSAADAGDYDALVRAAMQANGGDRRKAIETVNRRHPDAHMAFLAQHNPQRRKRHALELRAAELAGE